MDDFETAETSRTDVAAQRGDSGMSRRTMIRRTAVAGGALLWATPVVQTLGNNTAFAHFRGSGDPGGCLCKQAIDNIIPISCKADYAGKHRLAPKGKTVVLQIVTAADCGTRLHCEEDSQQHEWSQVSAVGCKLVSASGDTCVVHVSKYPASIELRVVSTLTCVGGRGHHKSCTDTKVRKICFTRVTGSGSQRCGRYEPHVNNKHGTVPCRDAPHGPGH